MLRRSHAAQTLRRASRSLCAGRGQQPWAIPFAVQEREALGAFDSWKKTGHLMTTGSFALKSIRAERVPAYVFSGQALRGTFTGVLTYRSQEPYLDTNGKVGMRTVRHEYWRHDIPFVSRRPMGLDSAHSDDEKPAVYAGFDYRTQYVEGALLHGLSEAALSRAVPLTWADDPPFTGVGAFTMKPSFAFVRAHGRMRRVAIADADNALRSDPHVRSLEFPLGKEWPRFPLGFSLPSAVFGHDVACPARDSRQPDIVEAMNVQYEVEGASLHERGVLLLPVWVVEYTFGGEGYRCFVSGIDGHVGGITHLLSQDASLRGAALGAFVGLAAAAAVKTPLALLAGPAGGAMMGGLTGYMMASRRRDTWEEEGRKRRRDEEDDRRWQAQQYWQREVRRVMAAAAGGSEGAAGGSKFRRRRGAAKERFRADKSAANQGRAERLWEQMDDYELLGLQRRPAPTAAAVAAAYRREAMQWHPDHNQQLPAAELADCDSRFWRLNEAYGRVRRNHAAR